MKTVSPGDCVQVTVRPDFIRHRSLRSQLDLTLEALGADADDYCYDVIDEWRKDCGYHGAAWQALDRHAADVPTTDWWNVATLRALLLRPQNVLFLCPADSPDRAHVEQWVRRLKKLYPLRNIDIQDEGA